MNYKVTIEFSNNTKREFTDCRGEVVGMFYTLNFNGGSKERFHVNTIFRVSEEYIEREAYA